MTREATFDEQGLVPGVIQDATTGRILMLGYLSEESLHRTVETGEVHFWSRSRRELWHKGATSGNTMQVVEISHDCDGDALLIRVDPAGPACHTGAVSCFGDVADQGFAWLEHLWSTIASRVEVRPEGSYTAHLVERGVEGTGAKVIEEAAEVVEAAMQHRDAEVGERRVAEEAADTLYHLLVLLAERSIAPSLVIDVLRERAG